MMAALIFLISLVTLFMFFVSYCRSMMASAAGRDISNEVRDVTGIHETAAAKDYDRVVQILQLCPEHPQDRSGLQAINFYYACLNVGKQLFSKVIPSLNSWTEHEQAGCAYFAAVELDRRIAFNRELLSQQAES